MSSTPAAKRRRIDAASATLRQPFRSPVVKRPPNDVTTPAAGSAARGGAILGTPGRTRMTALGQDTPSRAARGVRRPDFVWRERRAEFEAKNAALEDEIVRLRDGDGDGEVTVENGTGDDELDGLIVKWRAAAQQAADELFETSRSRVQNMGGMKELAAMRRRQAEFFKEEMGGRPSKKPGSDDGSMDGDWSPGSQEEQDEQEDEEKEYTMATMLRSLNIDVHVIGYDEAEGSWK
ncbi:uncharacterized protein DNG_04790 [Cephalotrichum gorgonifer]|uniref:Uncharacterized protein n=1 Tax=Cephalotrichum gorgonifer TaxID=2041049 RepID=A0AAE8SVN5_9PEZI|nr:uncharacterized protein DNG_04790 [Cephalotrichum gorgonifer]